MIQSQTDLQRYDEIMLEFLEMMTKVRHQAEFQKHSRITLDSILMVTKIQYRVDFWIQGGITSGSNDPMSDRLSEAQCNRLSFVSMYGKDPMLDELLDTGWINPGSLLRTMKIQ